MSQRALTLAVVQRLQEKLGLDRTGCDVRPPPGKPIAMAGQTFISVVDGSGSANDLDYGLDEYCGVEVTVSVRAGWVPDDRAGTDLIEAGNESPETQGLNALCEKVRAVLHMDYRTILVLANSIIGAGVANGFFEPLRLRAPGKVQERHADWFSATEAENDNGTLNVGYSRTLGFAGARRIQEVSSQT
jgi:hypothetical protein